MLNLSYLEYFVLLAKVQHYGRAAELLQISQPGLSHAIAALEKTLGVPLFQKNGRGIILSSFGVLFLPEARKLLELQADCLRAFRQLRLGGGLIRLSSVTPIASTLVVQLARDFLQTHPACDFSFHVGMSDAIYADLREGRIDLGFCSKPTPDPSILYTPVHQQRMLVALPADHPLAQADSLDLEETLPYPQIIFSKDSGLRSRIDALYGKRLEARHVAYEVPDADLLLGLVACGFGIAILPDLPATRIHKNLHLLPLREPHSESLFYVMRRKGSYPLCSIEDFYDFILQACTKL